MAYRRFEHTPSDGGTVVGWGGHICPGVPGRVRGHKLCLPWNEEADGKSKAFSDLPLKVKLTNPFFNDTGKWDDRILKGNWDVK